MTLCARSGQSCINPSIDAPPIPVSRILASAHSSSLILANRRFGERARQIQLHADASEGMRHGTARGYAQEWARSTSSHALIVASRLSMVKRRAEEIMKVEDR